MRTGGSSRYANLDITGLVKVEVCAQHRTAGFGCLSGELGAGGTGNIPTSSRSNMILDERCCSVHLRLLFAQGVSAKVRRIAWMERYATCLYEYKERSQKWRFTSIRANIRVTLICIECLISHSSAHAVTEQECPRCDK